MAGRVVGSSIHQAGLHYTAAIEGFRYRPNTTHLEAQRIGLELIRSAVGEDVLLDKDGSPMLAPVGLVWARRAIEHVQGADRTFEPLPILRGRRT